MTDDTKPQTMDDTPREPRKTRNPNPGYIFSTRKKAPMYTPSRSINTDGRSGAGASIPFSMQLVTSKIPAGVALETIPSPGNLKKKVTTRRGMKNPKKAVEQTGVEGITGAFGAIALGNGKTGTLDDESTNKMKESNKDASAITTTTRSKSKKEANMKKAGTSDVFENTNIGRSDTAMEIPEVLHDPSSPTPTAKQPQNTSAQADAESDTDNEVDDVLAAEEAQQRDIILDITKKNWPQNASLWDVEEKHVEQLQGKIGPSNIEGPSKDFLESMLDVTTCFRKFRESLDKFMEEAEKVGLELDWGAEDEAKD